MKLRVAASMRRINMLRFNNWMSDCVEVLGNNPNASSFDKYLIAWVKILKITEGLVTSLSLDDPSNMADLSESRVQIMITGFEKELETWKATFQPDGSNSKSYFALKLSQADNFSCFNAPVSP
jgi:hypothetical protein